MEKEEQIKSEKEEEDNRGDERDKLTKEDKGMEKRMDRKLITGEEKEFIKNVMRTWKKY